MLRLIGVYTPLGAHDPWWSTGTSMYKIERKFHNYSILYVNLSNLSQFFGFANEANAASTSKRLMQTWSWCWFVRFCDFLSIFFCKKYPFELNHYYIQKRIKELGERCEKDRKALWSLSTFVIMLSWGELYPKASSGLVYNCYHQLSESTRYLGPYYILNFFTMWPLLDGHLALHYIAHNT